MPVIHTWLRPFAVSLLIALTSWVLWNHAHRTQPLTLPASPESVKDSKPEAEPPLLPAVAHLVEQGSEQPYLRCLYLIKELPTDLAPQDLRALIAFISGPPPTHFLETEWGSLVNDIEEALTVQKTPSHEVAQALIAIHRDETSRQLLRDYALQHLGGFAIYLVHTGHLPAPVDSPIASLFTNLVAELDSAAGHADRPWAGTALNLLDGLLRAADSHGLNLPNLTADHLVQLAIPLALNPSAPLNVRLPGLQVATRRHAPEVLPLARRILETPDASIMLIQCASATLAELGTPDDLKLLERLAPQASVHTQVAINEAMRAISQRTAPR